MIAVDLAEGRLYGEDEIIDRLAERPPLHRVAGQHGRAGAADRPRARSRASTAARSCSAARPPPASRLEDLELILAPMVEDGKEAVGSMGDDTPAGRAVATSTGRWRTSSARTSARSPTRRSTRCAKTGVMSLKTRFKNLGNILAEDETQTDVFVLESPVLTTGMYERMLDVVGEQTSPSSTAPCRCPTPRRLARRRPARRPRPHPRRGRGRRPARLRPHRPDRRGARRRTAPAMPMILATGAVHACLVGQRPAHLRLDHRPLGRVPGHALLRRAGRRRRHGGQRLPGAGELPGPACERGLFGDLTLRDVVPELQEGDRGGPAEDPLQDGHLGHLLLSRRLQLRGASACRAPWSPSSSPA